VGGEGGGETRAGETGGTGDAGDAGHAGGSLPNVIVVGTMMDQKLLETVPPALSGAAVGMGYSRDALTLLTLSQYITNLGYTAVPSMNDSANGIPYTIQGAFQRTHAHMIAACLDAYDCCMSQRI
jgi:hypothetical protein